MQMWSHFAGCALLVIVLVAGDASITSSHVAHGMQKKDTLTLIQSAINANSIDQESAFGAMVESMMHGKGPGVAEVVKAAQKKMALGDAVKRLQSKLPSNVIALVGSHNEQPFSEESLQKALTILNNMVSKAWEELDKEIIKCKEFEDRNRGTYDQVMTDLARLAEQISDLERQRDEANENINTKEMEFLQIKFELRKQTVIYMKIKWANTQEMTIRKNDLEVMTFVLELTKCKEGSTTAITAGLAQVGQRGEHSGARVCRNHGGELVFGFDDPKLEAQLEQKMTPRVRQSLREVLGRAVEVSKTSLLQTDPTTTVTTTTTVSFPTPPVPKAAVRERVSAEGFWKICKRDEEVDCGLLNDNMSLEWGKFKDAVDELQHEMDQNEAKFFALRTDLNSQMEIIKIAKARFMMMLAEAISNLNADQSEQAKKEQQREELDAQYYKFMAECKRVIMEITFTNICAVIKVRNEVMSHSTIIKEIIDCDISSWVPGDCSVMCDDSCPTIFKPTDDPYMCGGWQTLTRDVIVKPNQYGVACPALSTTRKCNQQKCPVDCEMSMWSGWSKCTKDCEGGVRGRTRSILTKTKNGGESCNTAQEEESCNTGSCDRDCTLESWTDWGFCSMACGGGLQERTRRVLIPTRGEGVCPKDDSAERFNERACNTHDCIGDEICIAKQDLVIAIDGSGSLRESGFKIVKNFAVELIDRYKGKYFSAPAMQIGVVLFGNGEVLADGTISPAVQVHKLSGDMASVKTSIEGIKYQRGFTNMAQALVTAEKMFLSHGRKKAQSAVMMITDGKPTLLYETNEKVVDMKDKAVKLFFAPITEAKGKEIDLMKRWASQPWQSHFVHVPGLMPLKADGSVFASKFIATFCPEAMSPSATATEEKDVGYFLLKEHAICGDPTAGSRLSTSLRAVGDCAALVRAAVCGPDNKPCEAFSYGEWYRKGYCYSEVFPIDSAKIADWRMSREDPNAPCDASMGWVDNSFYDTYVLEATTDTI